MEIRFKDGDLAKLYADPRTSLGLPASVVTAFRKRVQAIRAAPDERLFYQLKSLHFEKLKGARSHQHSMRLNDQWRLILETEGESPNKCIVIISIEDYH